MIIFCSKTACLQRFDLCTPIVLRWQSAFIFFCFFTVLRMIGVFFQRTPFEKDCLCISFLFHLAAGSTRILGSLLAYRRSDHRLPPKVKEFCAWTYKIYEVSIDSAIDFTFKAKMVYLRSQSFEHRAQF